MRDQTEHMIPGVEALMEEAGWQAPRDPAAIPARALGEAAVPTTYNTLPSPESRAALDGFINDTEARITPERQLEIVGAFWATLGRTTPAIPEAQLAVLTAGLRNPRQRIFMAPAGTTLAERQAMVQAAAAAYADPRLTTPRLEVADGSSHAYAGLAQRPDGATIRDRYTSSTYTLRSAIPLPGNRYRMADAEGFAAHLAAQDNPNGLVDQDGNAWTVGIIAAGDTAPTETVSGRRLVGDSALLTQTTEAALARDLMRLGARDPAVRQSIKTSRVTNRFVCTTFDSQQAAVVIDCDLRTGRIVERGQDLSHDFRVPRSGRPLVLPPSWAKIDYGQQLAA